MANKTQTLYVRVNLKTGTEKFYRCGMVFTRTWQRVTDVDDATAKRLEDEQMLEVSTDVPADYVAEAAAAPAAENIPVVPTDPAERATAIKAAIGTLNVDNGDLWMKGGEPRVPAIEAALGWKISAAERDTVWGEIQGAQ